MSDTIAGLGRWNVQTFLATHDYALTSELELRAETEPPVQIAFFGLRRGSDGSVSVVERGETLASFQHNPILDAISSLHEREQAEFYRGLSEAHR